MAKQTNPEDFFAELKQKTEAYIGDRLLLFKLQSTKKLSKLIAGLIAGLIVCVFLLFVVLFLSIAAAICFSNLMHNAFYGFGIVAGIYLLLFFVVIIFRKPLIQKPIIALIIKILLDK